MTTFYDSAINEYYIIVYEKYGATPTTQASDTSATLYAFNGSLRHPDWIDFDYQNYNADTNNSTSPRLFLTSWPRAKRYYCGLDERVFLGIICDDTGMNLRVRIYNSSNTQIATDLVAVTLSNFIVFDASPSTIIANTSITQGNFDAAAYYTIEARPTGGGAYSGASEAFRIDIDLECHRYDTKRLHWLNKFGVWDSFTFTLVSVDSTNVESYAASEMGEMAMATTQAFAASVAGAIMGAQSMEEAIKSTLEGLAQEAIARSIFATAMGFSALALGPVGGVSASQYFQSIP